MDSPTTSFIAQHGPATLEVRKGIHIAHLRGTPEAMGRQHAELARQVNGDAVLRYLDGLIEKLIAHAVPAIAGPGAALLKRVFHLRNRGRIGDDVLGHLRGMATGFGMPQAQLERMFFVPDIIHYLAGRSFVQLAFPPMCSGFFATGPATRDGKTIIARNFDFFGRNVWNTANAIVVMHPDGGQRVMLFGALGASAAPQGINEAGIAISLHTNFCRDVATTGVPLFSVVHNVLAKATTLDEAIRIITAQPRLCSLSAFVSDTRARTAAVVGFSARHHEVVPVADGVLVRTNHLITEEMRRFEVAPHAWQLNSRGRFQRVNTLLAEKRGTLAPEDVPAILSDCFDPYEGRKCVTGSIIAGTNNTQSLVISPDDDALYIAHADHPVCHSELFSGFRISALMDGNSAAYEMGDLCGGAQLNTTEQAALREYIEAWSASFDGLDNLAAVAHLRRASELQPGEPIFARMAGLLLLKEKRYAEALPLLLRNCEGTPVSPLLRAEAHIWAGRCLDLLGRRDEALAHYEKAAALDAAPVSPAARRHLKHPFRAWQLFEVTPEFIVAGAMARY